MGSHPRFKALLIGLKHIQCVICLLDFTVVQCILCTPMHSTCVQCTVHTIVEAIWQYTLQYMAGAPDKVVGKLVRTKGDRDRSWCQQEERAGVQ